MFSLLARFLSPAKLLRRARRLAAEGRTAPALTTIEICVEKLQKSASWPLLGEASAVHGSLLLTIGRADDAVRPLLLGRNHIDSGSRAFLARALLRRRSTAPETLEVLTAYLAAPADASFGENIASLRMLARPAAGSLGRARQWNKAVAAARPDFSWPHLHLGVLHVHDGDFGRAAFALRRACERDPRDNKANALLAYALARNGDAAEAAAILSARPASGRGIMLLRGHTYRILGDAKAAADWFRRADEAAPLDTEALSAYVESLINAGQLDDARRALKRLKRETPSRSLLRAAASESEAQAFKLLCRLVSDGQLAAEASKRLPNAALRHFVKSYNAGRYEEILRSAADELPETVDTSAIETVVAHAVVQFIRSHPEDALELVERVCERFPSLDVQAARALLFAKAGELERVLEVVDDSAAGEPEVLVQLARAAVLTDDRDRAAGVLPQLERSGERGARVAAAYFAAGCEWESAIAALQAYGAEPVYVGALTAFVRAEAGDLREAERLCAAVPAGHPAAPAARSLSGWIGVRNALGRPRHELAQALSLWQSGSGDAEWIYGRLLPLFIDTDLRGDIELALQQLPRAPATYHLTSLYHLGEAARHARAGQWDRAFTSFEHACAYVCTALADDDYVSEWSARRLAAYGAAHAVDRAALWAGIAAAFRNVIRSWPENEPLELSFRAELRAVQLLKETAGIDTWWGGPAFVALNGWERTFAETLAECEQHRNADKSDVMQLLRRMLSGEEEPPQRDTAVQSLRRAYSELRIAAVLDEDGHVDEALASLSELGNTAKNDPSFASRNPAYAFDGGEERFREELDRMQIELRLKAGERLIAASAHLEEGIDYWREALLTSYDQWDETAAQIRQIALGRTQVLDDGGRPDEGIPLLEAVNELCGGDEIQGQLALLHTHCAIQKVNETGDWSYGVTAMRKARELNAQSTYIDRNLVLALGNLAAHLSENDDASGACALLLEAQGIARANVVSDPHSTDWQTLMLNVRQGLTLARISAGNPSPDDIFDAMFYATEADSARLSAVYHNRGVAKAREGKLDEALDDLNKALELEPASDATRQALASVGLSRILHQARRNW
ncbi:MAG TPA: tetratricopeptide repeat protein [Thermoanaerobaculia bacterium]|nr:tetratricopeptide repeat protein [Thermoanaerobaculia bacterium]